MNRIASDTCYRPAAAEVFDNAVLEGLAMFLDKHLKLELGIKPSRTSTGYRWLPPTPEARTSVEKLA